MHIYTTKIFTVWSKFEDVTCSKYVQNMRTYTDTHICTYTIKMHVYIYTHTQVHIYIEHFRIFFPCEKEIPINVHMCVFPRLPFLTETKCKEMVKERENYTLTTRFIGSPIAQYTLAINRNIPTIYVCLRPDHVISHNILYT